MTKKLVVACGDCDATSATNAARGLRKLLAYGGSSYQKKDDTDTDPSSDLSIQLLSLK